MNRTERATLIFSLALNGGAFDGSKVTELYQEGAAMQLKPAELRLARQFGEYVRARRKTLGYPKMISPP